MGYDTSIPRLIPANSMEIGSTGYRLLREAQDKGDPTKQDHFMDIIYQISYPF